MSAVARPTEYSALLSAEAAESLLRLNRRRQRALLDRIRELARNPFLVSDYCVTDEDGHAIEHLLVDEFLLAYWVDHASRQVLITEFDDLA